MWSLSPRPYVGRPGTMMAGLPTPGSVPQNSARKGFGSEIGQPLSAIERVPHPPDSPAPEQPNTSRGRNLGELPHTHSRNAQAIRRTPRCSIRCPAPSPSSVGCAAPPTRARTFRTCTSNPLRRPRRTELGASACHHLSGSPSGGTGSSSSEWPGGADEQQGVVLGRAGRSVFSVVPECGSGIQRCDGRPYMGSTAAWTLSLKSGPWGTYWGDNRTKY